MKITLATLFLFPLILCAEPEWIWTSKNAGPTEKADFRADFVISGGIKKAVLKLTCDNGATALINGKKVIGNTAWQEPSEADVKADLREGKNEILVQAYNEDGIAALVATLVIEGNDGKTTTVETDSKWQAAAHGKTDWKPAVTIAKYGDAPWGLALAGNVGKPGKPGRGGKPGKAGQAGPADAPVEQSSITALPGFKVEHLYTVPKAEQGSWVALTVDKKGRLLCGDQYGGIYRLTPPPIGSSAPSNVERLDVHIGGAHGLLYAHESLYVMLDEGSAPEAKGMKQGLYRLKDSDGDDHFGEPVLLSGCKGSGEHGPHSIQLSPDGKNIFFNNGNHTSLPENLAITRAAKGQWGEDHILPRMWDANGHARGILAPGGYICKTDPDGKKVELFCAGFRNEFDFAFDANGEMFTYDADMEWDLGAPWYRPTRINHCVSGGEYGWRSGTGKWPAYYEDSLPAAVDIGPGSPTGTVFGTAAKFPEKYQRALFGNDWTYGTMYAIHFTTEGAGYKAVKEEFIFGKPLPLTDVVINPHDGAMYFATGGRRTQSAVYRVTYEGKESTAPAAPYAVSEGLKQRRELDKLHDEGTGPQAIDKAWPFLGSKDRYLRFAARVAIERQPATLWLDRALNETDPQALIEAMIAYARVGGTPLSPSAPVSAYSSGAVPPATPENAKLQGRILAALGGIDFKKLDLDHQLQLVRAYQLAFTRLGKPEAAICVKGAEHFDALYPQTDSMLNRELCQLLVFLDSKSVVSKTLGLMATAKDDAEALATDELLSRNAQYAEAAEVVHKSRPNRQQMFLMWSLRNAKAGWTSDSRKTYFSWFPHARTWKGGNSFKGFIENARKEALVNFVPPNETAELDALSSKNESILAANITPPKGPGKAYTTDEIVKLATGGMTSRNFAQGKNLFSAVMCATCHHCGGDGGPIGPDITGAGNRYSLRDLVENITEPSKVISDQYGSHQIEKTDGSIVVGRIISEEGGKVNVMTNPFAPNVLFPIESKDIKSKKDYPVSMMPPGLINSLNEDELKDLLAYLLSGGNDKDKMFAP